MKIDSKEKFNEFDLSFDDIFAIIDGDSDMVLLSNLLKPKLRSEIQLIVKFDIDVHLYLKKPQWELKSSTKFKNEFVQLVLF